MRTHGNSLFAVLIYKAGNFVWGRLRSLSSIFISLHVADYSFTRQLLFWFWIFFAIYAKFVAFLSGELEFHAKVLLQEKIVELTSRVSGLWLIAAGKSLAESKSRPSLLQHGGKVIVLVHTSKYLTIKPESKKSKAYQFFCKYLLKRFCLGNEYRFLDLELFKGLKAVS